MNLILTRIIPQAGDAATFVFEPTEPLDWRAGNSFHLEVPGDYAPIEHTFTISSAPSEGHLAITTRPSGSAYKRSLFALKPGDIVVGTAFGGTFTWQSTTLRPVFVAAGIGITPFRAMLHERVFYEKPLAITLVYGTTTDIIFKDELDGLAAGHPEFGLHYVIGERLGIAHIKQFADPDKSLFYVAGPSAMVDDITATLLGNGVLESQLVRDWFTGKLPQGD